MVSIQINWNDPLLPDKAREFFLAFHKEIRAEALAKKTKQIKQASTHSDVPKGTSFSLDLSNLPEDYLEAPHFTKLMSAYIQANQALETPPQETDDAETAAIDIIRRHLLNISTLIIYRLFLFLMLDKRFNPTSPIQVNAVGAFDFIGSAKEDYEQIAALFGYATLYGFITHSLPANARFANELETLHLAGDIFFDTARTIFPVDAIAKCHCAFSMLIANFGKPDEHDLVTNFARHLKTMSRAIIEWQHHGGQVTNEQPNHSVDEIATSVDHLRQGISCLTDSVNSNTKVIANMDRRQKNFLTHLRRIFDGFIKIFRPRAKPPTREQVVAVLSPTKRYACLDRIDEPHRSQIKAVIDHTCKHPIVFGSKNRDEYTLASAARDVWNKNESRWSHVSGCFQTYDQLKAACYNLQGKPNDPFVYQK